jgi:hypothetical protein
MKGKFKLLGHIGLTLFVMSALMVALVPIPVQAATAVTSVWVEFDDTNSRNSVGLTTNEYMIHFKPTTALVRGIDWVTVTFPDGTATMGGAATTYAFSISGTVAATDLEFSTNYGTIAIGSATWYQSASAATTGGYRVKVKVPINISAGTDVWLNISSTSITAAATAGDSYKVYVSTTKDTTSVLSSAFSLGHATTVVTSVGCSVAPATAGATGQYIIDFTPATQLTASTGTVTVRFPIGTTLPSSISASNIEFKEYGGSSYTACGVTPTVDANRRIVTATTPVTLGTGGDNYIKFNSAAGVTNPTIADDSGDYYVAVRTTGDREWVIASADHDITAGSATKLVVANGEIGIEASAYSDDATMINMLSSQIYLAVADANGNTVAPASSVTVTPSSSSASGTFYVNSDATPGSGDYSSVTSITVTTASPATAAQQVYYKDTAAGTYTLTFSASGYTSATWTIKVAPAVSLYDSNNSLVSTYAATSTSPVAEFADTATVTYAQKYASDYINDAITASMAGDTVKLGDGIYEVDANSMIALSKKITLTSVSGASSTTIRNIDNVGHNTGAELNGAIQVTTDGTAANPIIIDGLTFQRLRTDLDICTAIINAGNDYVTVRNCVFNNIEPDKNSSFEGVIWFRSDDTITSWTISNNTFNSCVTTWPWMTSSEDKSGCIIVAGGGTTKQISGVTISGNTLTNCGQYGITFGGNGTKDATGTISNNAITNGYSSIDLCDYLSTVSLTGNTITGAYNYGVYLEGNNNHSVVIKNNTFTGSPGYGIKSDEIDDVVTINYNDISGNSTYGIQSTSLTSVTESLDCKYNWWGNATGPTYTALTGATITKSNPNGTGDSITDDVLYYPWLHKSRADVVADNASYQACTMKLVSGWNTLSTPVKLISTADSVDELIPSGMTIGYYYDATGWHLITTGYVLNACDAVYVKMSAVTYVLLKFDASAFSAPSKDLDAGWNLIGLAYLSSSGMDADDAVASVYKTAANLPGYSQVFSPSLNATQTDMYGAAGSSWTVSMAEHGGSTSHMFAGLGYWIYMQNAATLAGFEITPIAPDLD